MGRWGGAGLAVALLFCATGVTAGPWPREPGGLFLSLGQEFQKNGGWQSLYTEYGLTPRLTLGLDAGQSKGGDRTIILFLQRAFGDLEARNKMTASIGIGSTIARGEKVMLGQIGASYGRGFQTRWGPGWLALDSRYRVLPTPGETFTTQDDSTATVTVTPATVSTTLKTEATLGLSTANGARLWIAQLQLENSDIGGSSAKLATGIAQRIAGPLRAEIGLITPLSGEGEAALKVGLWLEF